MILYTAILGGGGTEAAGYQPSDVCTLTVHLAQLAYKLELTSVQGRMLVNGWHMKLNLKSAKRILSSPVDKYSVNEYIEILNARAFY